jgi:hypothetical protein
VSAQFAPISNAPRDQVLRVYRKSRIGRWTRVLIEAGIGAAAGAVPNATVSPFFHKAGKDISGPLIGAATAIGAGIGVPTGGRSRTIHQRK